MKINRYLFLMLLLALVWVAMAMVWAVLGSSIGYLIVLIITIFFVIIIAICLVWNIVIALKNNNAIFKEAKTENMTKREQWRIIMSMFSVLVSAITVFIATIFYVVSIFV